ncbi:helix-turn-helix domain-containing protein [Photobacterium sp. OFAV2-7]|uniref:helix-turn-helix domain-containing protein n=1 Tax=Photobacterium sp. OFAV2-7 TaxID=2917748 RepID=UPI001EF45AB4|nr:helix-turn-helix domain-containing protein [Photobacterium sp. OFAV2-7]MCG7585154.1 AraC family transcriptional regulator [Photobacterium sp. OFAV2-7]
METDLQLIKRLVSQIEDNLADEADIVSLAASFQVSPWHFQRLFKSLVGDTLGNYIRGRRLTRAAHLLLNTQWGIIDIAFHVGFNSHEAFTRSFKSHFQLTPKQFRQQRPAVRQNEKPLLTVDLYQHFARNMQREPTIIKRPELSIVGFEISISSPFLSPDGYCDLLVEPWMNLFNRQGEVENRLPDTFYGLTVSPSGNFTEESLNYISAVPVTSLGKLPQGMVVHTFPEQWVAMFDVHTVDADTVGKTMDYIYGYWLPNSGYKRGLGDDYEYFEGTEYFDLSKLKSKYVIPLDVSQ